MLHHEVVFLFGVLLKFTFSLNLPDYIKPCNRSDPKLDECMVKHGQAAISRIMEGDAKYRVPVMDPLEIHELRVAQGTQQIGLRMTLRNVKVHGMKDSIFIKSKTDLIKRHLVWRFMVSRLIIIGDYEVDGRILFLPIVGQGLANITMTGLRSKYDCDWNLVNKNGMEYMNFTTNKLIFKNGQVYFSLKNLFNGDVFLGDSMNRFLNDNWMEVTKEIGPPLGEAFSEVFTHLLTTIAAQVPYSKIFLF